MKPFRGGLWLAALLAAVCLAAETPVPPPPTRWVTDLAGMMDEPSRAALDGRLEAYERETGHQLLVYIAPTTEGVPIEDWAVRAFERWKVGRRGLDDGVVLFVMTQDRRMRLEVGYGLEGAVTDADCSRILNEIAVPRLRGGDPVGAVRGAMGAVVARIAGRPVPGPEEATVFDGAEPAGAGAAPPEKVGKGQLILFGIAALFFLILFITNPSLALSLLFQIIFSGRGGG
ncbi:MAG TPA: TPM domain-containing protein, partial [Candidatus Aminicenantes bacterium]|nr:TPM domain-containing protein [Candidatus Aminicenantes bacterium]